jgi:hypothetical protein
LIFREFDLPSQSFSCNRKQAEASFDSFGSIHKTENMKKNYSLLYLFAVLTASCIAQTTYKDVAPVFYSRCTTCHHEGQHAPSMMNYTETAAHSVLIKADLNSGKMPPWPADTTYHRFLHERLISPSEKAAILAWISGGSAKGDTTLAPPAPVYSSQAKLHGTPDLILKIPTFSSNATSSTDVYDCFAIPTGLLTDRIIQAYEIIPGNATIVHHVIANIDTTGTVNSDLTGGCFTEPGDFSIGGYVPGCLPTVFPGKAPLKAGIRVNSRYERQHTDPFLLLPYWHTRHTSNLCHHPIAKLELVPATEYRYSLLGQIPV